ncbi:hypothetical protein N9B43_04390 [Mariniblastus sp.]|nr:hypothetical protein [Mariniblastus sp.]
MKSLSFLVFVVVTIFCWGIYGPVLHIGQGEMAGGEGKASLRPFMCVGIAYFLIAVVYPIVILKTTGEKGQWSMGGIFWSFTAGAVGAIGALGIVLAFKFQGKPVYVMPLVFGLAPIVNTFVTMFMSGTFKQASRIFYAGILIVAVGAAGVLTFKPTEEVKKENPTSQLETSKSVITLASFRQESDGVQDSSEKPVSQDEATDKPDEDSAKEDSAKEDSAKEDSAKEDSAKEDSAKEDSAKEDSAKEDSLKKTDEEFKDEVEKITAALGSEKSKPNLFIIALCIGITAVSWGAYGPVLHKGQAKMGGGRLRPFLCVGLAYFAIAVIVPWILLGTGVFEEPGGWKHIGGVFWSLLAGAAGAVGALGIIYAFNFGGKPIFIMPLVFGFAPVVNTLTETISKNLLGEVSFFFIGSLAMVIVGAIIVLVFAPRGAKPKAATN